MKPKGLAALIIAKEKGPAAESKHPDYSGDEEEAEGEEGGSNEGLTACAEGLISAVNEENPAGVVSALKHFFDIYGGNED